MTKIEKQLVKCRVCGKKRQLGDDGMCGKCLQESGALPGGDEACLGEGDEDAITTEKIAEAQAALDAEEGVIELGATKEQAPKVDTLFGPGLGEGIPEIPKVILTKFHKRLPKDRYTPGNPTLLAVATTPESKEKMMVLANNGRRMLRLETKETKGATYYGVYAY